MSRSESSPAVVGQGRRLSGFAWFLDQGAAALPVFGLVVCWIVFGLIGHDPWKPDEAYTWGLVNHILKTGHMVVPTLAGEPFMEKPPLYFITAAGTARLFSAWLPLYDGGRLASGLYVGLAILLTALATRHLFGRPRGAVAALFLAGSLGLVLDAHEMITDTSLFAGMAMAFFGLSLARGRPAWAGFLIGTGAGAGFLSKGLIAPGLVGLVALALPLLFPLWRSRQYLAALSWAALFALPWLVVWPVALYRQSPPLFREWFWVNNWGRFLGFVHLGPENSRWFYPKTLLWYAFPAWPFALAALWRRRSGFLADPGLQLGSVMAAVTLLVLMVSHDSRELYAMPLLIPLAVLAAADFPAAPRALAKGLQFLSLVLFPAAALALWCGWIAFVLHWPQGVYAAIADRLPGAPVIAPGPLALAILASAIVLFALFRRPDSDSPMAPLKSWMAGLTLVWILLTTVWLAPINTVKSYRSMMISLSQHLPAGHGCLSSENLGEPQRALLDYYGGIKTQRADVTGRIDCHWLLVSQSGAPIAPWSRGARWREAWSGHRPGDDTEHYALFETRRYEEARAGR